MTAGVGAAVLAVTWTTPCCDRTPARLPDGHYVCRVCGVKWFDTLRDVRRVFGNDVVNVIAPVERELKVMTQDEYMTERWLD